MATRHDFVRCVAILRRCLHPTLSLNAHMSMQA
jgi:hypothetical protein